MSIYLQTTSAPYSPTNLLPVTAGGTATGTAFTQGSVVFAGAGGTYSQDNANLFWNDTALALGIGTQNPATTLDVEGSQNTVLQVGSSNIAGTSIQLNNTTTGAHSYQVFATGSTNVSGTGNFGVYDVTANRTPFVLNGATSIIATTNNGVYAWSTAANFANLTVDSGISRISAAELAIGNGTQGDFSGTLAVGKIGVGNSAPAEVLDVTGNVRTKHLRGSTNTPTIAAGTGAGTGPTVSIVGTDLAGTITVTTGTLPTVNAVICTVTFNTAYTAAPYVVFSLASAVTTTPNVYVSGTTTTAFSLQDNNASLAATTTYKWNYIVIQ